MTLGAKPRLDKDLNIKKNFDLMAKSHLTMTLVGFTILIMLFSGFQFFVFTNDSNFTQSKQVGIALPSFPENQYSSEQISLSPPAVNGYTVNFNGVACPGANVSAIEWNWGDGQTTTGFFPESHTYSESGKYNVTVTALYDNGTTASTSSEFVVGPGYRYGGFTVNIATGVGGNISYQSSVGNGIVTQSSSVSLYMAGGDPVCLYAENMPYYSFSSWSLSSNASDTFNQQPIDAANAQITVAENGNSTIYATFVPLVQTVTTPGGDPIDLSASISQVKAGSSLYNLTIKITPKDTSYLLTFNDSQVNNMLQYILDSIASSVSTSTILNRSAAAYVVVTPKNLINTGSLQFTLLSDLLSSYQYASILSEATDLGTIEIAELSTIQAVNDHYELVNGSLSPLDIVASLVNSVFTEVTSSIENAYLSTDYTFQYGTQGGNPYNQYYRPSYLVGAGQELQIFLPDLNFSGSKNIVNFTISGDNGFVQGNITQFLTPITFIEPASFTGNAQFNLKACDKLGLLSGVCGLLGQTYYDVATITVSDPTTVFIQISGINAALRNLSYESDPSLLRANVSTFTSRAMGQLTVLIPGVLNPYNSPMYNVYLNGNQIGVDTELSSNGTSVLIINVTQNGSLTVELPNVPPRMYAGQVGADVYAGGSGFEPCSSVVVQYFNNSKWSTLFNSYTLRDGTFFSYGPAPSHSSGATILRAIVGGNVEALVAIVQVIAPNVLSSIQVDSGQAEPTFSVNVVNLFSVNRLMIVTPVLLDMEINQSNYSLVNATINYTNSGGIANGFICVFDNTSSLYYSELHNISGTGKLRMTIYVPNGKVHLGYYLYLNNKAGSSSSSNNILVNLDPHITSITEAKIFISGSSYRFFGSAFLYQDCSVYSVLEVIGKSSNTLSNITLYTPLSEGKSAAVIEPFILIYNSGITKIKVSITVGSVTVNYNFFLNETGRT